MEKVDNIELEASMHCSSCERRVLRAVHPLDRDNREDRRHDAMTEELSRYKLGAITSDDHDGYHWVMCPAAMGKLRCPRPGRDKRQDAPEARLPVQGPPGLLRPSHRGGTNLLHGQGPGHKRHRPRLVLAHGRLCNHAVPRVPVRGAEPTIRLPEHCFRVRTDVINHRINSASGFELVFARLRYCVRRLTAGQDSYQKGTHDRGFRAAC